MELNWTKLQPTSAAVGGGEGEADCRYAGEGTLQNAAVFSPQIFGLGWGRVKVPGPGLHVHCRQWMTTSAQCAAVLWRCKVGLLGG